MIKKSEREKRVCRRRGIRGMLLKWILKKNFGIWRLVTSGWGQIPCGTHVNSVINLQVQ
jgi:hypothetical protein